MRTNPRPTPSSPSRLAVPASLDDVLLYRMSRLLGTAGSMVIRLCEGSHGITRREWRLIASLALEGEMLSSELAERAQLDRARTSKAITSLVRKKLVQRQVKPGDRRKADVRLTDAGHALHEALYPLVLAINSELLSTLGAGEISALDSALDALQCRAEELVAAADLPKADRRRGGRVQLGMG